MSLFSSTFSSYFFKHFPQWRGHLTGAQEEKLVAIAQDMTNHKECQKVWEALESNSFLLSSFCQCVDLVLSARKKTNPDRIIGLWTGSILICLGVIYAFKKDMTPEIVGLFSAILGIFGGCLKESCQTYFSFSKSPPESK